MQHKSAVRMLKEENLLRLKQHQAQPDRSERILSIASSIPNDMNVTELET